MSAERYKLVLGPRQVETVISALAMLQTENEVHAYNVLNMTHDEHTKSDLAKINQESKIAEELQIKLLRMMRSA